MERGRILTASIDVKDGEGSVDIDRDGVKALRRGLLARGVLLGTEIDGMRAIFMQISR